MYYLYLFGLFIVSLIFILSTSDTIIELINCNYKDALRLALYAVLSISLVFSINEKLNLDPYYLKAESLLVDTNNNITVFATEQGMYYTNGVYYDTAPYLLTMNTKLTSNRKDDEILVVWRAE